MLQTKWGDAMAVTIGSVTEGNANAEEIKNNSPDSELYENNKKYLQGSLVKFNDKIYLAKRNVPSDVDLDNPYYWEIFMDAADSKRVDELFEKTGNLDELETESKDNLVAAINEVGSIQPDWAQNDETAKDYIKNRPFYEGTSVENLGTTFEGWRASCQSHGEDSMVINANVAGIDYQDVEGLVQTDTNGRYVHYYFGENRDYRIEVDRGMAQVTIRPAGTEYYFYKVSSTVKQIDPKYLPFEQADWNQNDDTKKDYVKGRTHWAEIKPVVEKVNVITDASYKYDSQGCYKINGAFMCPYPQNIELTEGTPITITIETESFTGQLSASTDTDLLEFSLRGQQVNGYKVPSAWYFFLEQHSISIYGEGSSSAPAMSFSITAEIEQEREVVHTLDPKYIEDMYYTKTIPGNTLLCAFDVSEGKHTSVELAFPLVVDSEYNLTIDGDSYGGNVAIDNGTITLNCAHGVLTVEPHNPLLGRWDGNPLKHHIEIAEYNHKIINQIDPKYIPNQNTVFEARLFMDGSIPYRLNLESGIAVGDLIKAFDEGQRVIARLCPYEDGYGYPFEMQMYIPGSSRDIPNTIMFAPCSISSASIDGEIQGMSTVIIGFEDGDWYFSGFALDAIEGAAFETPYTIPFEVNAMYCETFDALVSATQDFRWRAYIYKGNHKLYLQVPEYSPSVTPNILYFTGITEPAGSGISSCVWTTVRIPVSSSNVILWDDSTLAASNTALDTWDYYKLNKDQSGALRVYDVFNEKITNLGLVGKGVIEYGDYRYLFNRIAGYSLLFYCMDFTNSSVPKISTISIDRRTNTIGVTNFHPLCEIATESEVNNAVDDIFKTI